MLQVKMSDSSRAFLEKHLPEFFTQPNLDEALLALDAFISAKGLDENDDMTAFGHEAQYVYDEIYCCNE